VQRRQPRPVFYQQDTDGARGRGGGRDRGGRGGPKKGGRSSHVHSEESDKSEPRKLKRREHSDPSADRPLMASDTFHSNYIVLDTGKSTSIFKNPVLAHTNPPCVTDDGVSIGGTVCYGGTIETFMKMETAFGEVHFSEKCAGKILCDAHVKDNAYSCYQRADEDAFSEFR